MMDGCALYALIVLDKHGIVRPLGILESRLWESCLVEDGLATLKPWPMPSDACGCQSSQTYSRRSLEWA